MLDLSHELDLARYLCGPLSLKSGSAGRISELEIDSEDCADLLLSGARSAEINLHLDYLSRFPVRRGLLHTAKRSVEYDLIAGWLRDSLTGEKRYAVERDDTYRAQLKALLEESSPILCTLEEGRDAVALVEQTKKEKLCP